MIEQIQVYERRATIFVTDCDCHTRHHDSNQSAKGHFKNSESF